MKCVCCIDGMRLAGAGADSEFTIEVAGQRYRFEMHRYSGPAVLNSKGHPADRQPGPQHLFWTAVTLWAQQGAHVGSDGLCAWAPEPEPDMVHLGGRHYTLTRGALAAAVRANPTTDGGA